MKAGIEHIDDYDPIRDSNLITPIDAKEFSSTWINNLYREEHLTQDEYIVLDYLGTTTKIKEGSVTMSFQGLKRMISIHQARLTKAINRLMNKEMLKKVDAGYTVTEKGIEVFRRLYDQYKKRDQFLPNQLYTHVSRGNIQGPKLGKHQFKNIAEGLVGKWFGKFRFTSKIEYDNSIELGWVSTDGTLSASLIVGPENNLRLSLSAPIFSESQTELQILINHVSQSVETVIDAPVVFTNYNIYENRQNITKEIDDLKIPYAG